MNNLLLILGIGAIALVIGYIAGGSKSPIVSGVITGIFTLVTLGIGIMTSSELTNKLNALEAKVQTAIQSSTVKVPTNSPETSVADTALLKEVKTSLDELKSGLPNLSNSIGILLIVFAAAFFIGSVIGTLARVRNWFSQRRIAPWGENAPPEDFDNAIGWLLIKEKLAHMGYGNNLIKKIYENGKDKNIDFTAALNLLTLLPAQPTDTSPYSYSLLATHSFAFPDKPTNALKIPTDKGASGK